MTNYPRHITEPKRITIITELLEKECIKLLPSLKHNEWKVVAKDITAWFNGERSDLAPVHDFWNLADGIMVGSKLKQVVRYFSAENIEWERRWVDLSGLDIVWPVGELKGLDLPYTKKSINNFLQNNKEVTENNLKLSDAFETKYKPREHYPVILVSNSHGRYTVLDGNRRVLRAILYKKPAIEAYTGDYTAGDEPANYWITTGELRKLLYAAERASKERNDKVVDAIKTVLQNYFEISDIARINWDLRCRNQSDFSRTLVS